MSSPAELETVLETIRARRDEFEARYGIRLLGVFGSLARGDAGPESDIDILYDVTGRPTLFTLGRLYEELEDLFASKIDLCDVEVLRPRWRAMIERDFVPA